MVSFCSHQGVCGGCDFADQDYPAQLEYKNTYCRNLFTAFGVTAEPVIPSPQAKYFRNKMEFCINAEQGRLHIGMRQKARFDRVVDIKDCPVCIEQSGALLEAVRQWQKESATLAYDMRTRSGELRYVSIRHAKTTGELMVIISASFELEQLESLRGKYKLLAEKLANTCGVSSFYLCRNAIVSDTALSQEIYLIHGTDAIHESVNGIVYAIRPGTFFQTNSLACEKLYQAITHLAQEMPDPVYDMYCGSGGITLQLARQGKSVIGVDNSQRNIKDAQENAQLNKIGNAQFICADADAFMADTQLNACGMILDPPRSGLTNKFLQALVTRGPGALVYVSCNPLKFREELKKLEPAYTLQSVVPVDMFPCTKHMEVVALLKKK